MIDISKGKYWDLPWSLVNGCTPCSPGCDHCWSAAMTRRFHIRHLSFSNQAIVDANCKFTGEIILHPERISIPLKRRKPTVYAVWNDLFHEAVPPEFTFEAFDAMRNSQHHTFLVLTKRPQNINRNYFEIMERCIRNVHLGLTVCNQQEVDEKVPVFLQVPGKKFLSIEPMLGAIDFSNVPGALLPRGDMPANVSPITYWRDIDAVILGGETGHGARPMHPDWVRSVRDQCAAARVPFFFKGWGLWKPCDDNHMECKRHKRTAMRLSGKMVTAENPYWQDRAFNGTAHGFWRAGSKAGRLLDGQTHDELPWKTTV